MLIKKTKCVQCKVFMLVGNPEHVSHAWRNINLFGGIKTICDYSRTNRTPLADQITDIEPYVRTYFWVTISFKYYYPC